MKRILSLATALALAIGTLTIAQLAIQNPATASFSTALTPKAYVEITTDPGREAGLIEVAGKAFASSSFGQGNLVGEFFFDSGSKPISLLGEKIPMFSSKQARYVYLTGDDVINETQTPIYEVFHYQHDRDPGSVTKLAQFVTGGNQPTQSFATESGFFVLNPQGAAYFTSFAGNPNDVTTTTLFDEVLSRDFRPTSMSMMTPVSGRPDTAFIQGKTLADVQIAYIVNREGVVMSFDSDDLPGDNVLFFGSPILTDTGNFISAIIGDENEQQFAFLEIAPDSSPNGVHLIDTTGSRVLHPAPLLLNENEMTQGANNLESIGRLGNTEVFRSTAVTGYFESGPGLFALNHVTKTISVIPGTERMLGPGNTLAVSTHQDRIWFLGTPISLDDPLRLEPSKIFSLAESAGVITLTESLSAPFSDVFGQARMSGYLAIVGDQLLVSVEYEPSRGVAIYDIADVLANRNPADPNPPQNNGQNNNQGSFAPPPPQASDFTLPPTVTAGQQQIAITTKQQITAAAIGSSYLYVRKTATGYELQLPDGFTQPTFTTTITTPTGQITLNISQTNLRTLDSNVDPVITRNQDNVRVVLYDLVGSGKVQLFHNGREVAWINAKDTSDPKLRTAPQGHYLVRNLRLEPGKNVIEVYQDNNRMRRVAHTLR